MSKEWKYVILDRKVIWSKAISHYKIDMLKKIDETIITIHSNNQDIFCELSLKFNISFPDWKEVFQYFEVQRCPRIIVKLLNLMDNYLDNISLRRSWSVGHIP